MCTAPQLHLRAQRELRASPLNPKVPTDARSENSLSFDVWCLSANAAKFSGATPPPLSDTSTSSEPLSRRRTSAGECVTRGKRDVLIADSEGAPASVSLKPKLPFLGNVYIYKTLVMVWVWDQFSVHHLPWHAWGKDSVLTDAGGSSVESVLHQLFDSDGKTEHHLA